MALPVEIIAIIFAYISDQESLIIVLRASRLFKALAEPLLYRDISFDAPDPRTLLSRIQKFEQRILEDTHLAGYVTSYATDNADKLPTILPHLTNLRRLKIGANVNGFNPVQFSRFVSSPALTHLICRVIIRNVPTFIQFLESQPSLEVLHFCSRPGSSSFPLSADALPRLHSLNACVRVARSILQGRHIRHLKLFRSNNLDDLADRTFPSVLTLTTYFEVGQSDDVAVASRLFPNLKYIRFKAGTQWHYRFPQKAIEFLRQLAASAIEYICIEHLDNFDPCDDKNASPQSTGQLAACFNDIRSLRVLDIESCHTPALFFRYHTGCTTPAEMTFPPLEFANWKCWWERYDAQSLPLLGPDIASAGSTEASHGA